MKKKLQIMLSALMVLSMWGCSRKETPVSFEQRMEPTTEIQQSFDAFLLEELKEAISEDALSLHYALIDPSVYDIELKDEGKSSSISYWADSFSIDEHRILRVKSRDCGDITVQIDPNERVIINDVIVTDEWDELIEDMERQKVADKHINYNNVAFPERAKYVRHENRIYFQLIVKMAKNLLIIVDVRSLVAMQWDTENIRIVMDTFV